MKLLFVSHRRDVSGGEICAQRIVERIKDHRVLVVLPEGAFADRLRRAGIAVEIENGLTKMARSEDALAPLRMAGRFPGVVRRLRRVIRAFEADLVISNALGPLLYAGPAARLAGVPNICIHHHPVLRPGTSDAKLVSFLARFCDGFIAVSEAMKRGLQISGVPIAEIKTIYNGLDVADYAPSRDRSHILRGKLKLDDSAKLIGLVATICEAKGHHIVIEAARLLRDEFAVATPWRFIFVGGVFENSTLGATYQTRLEQQIQRNGLQDRVLFAGRQKNMRDVYLDLDIVLNTSIEPEPLGTTIYEAMAIGKPVIASHLGGSPEIVDNGRAGFLVPAGDSRELAALLANILQSRIDLAPIIAAGRARVETCFNLHNTVDQYLTHFASWNRDVRKVNAPVTDPDFEVAELKD
jgi:glycosyltransferase involved in cell wall biosynthesis